MNQKRVLAVHDISCFGRCSLTVALPIISSTGIECTVLPTAVLSTHTGGFKDFTFRDLTEDIVPIVDHWITENITFDAVYTGYLGSFEQIDLVINTMDRVCKDSLIVVDPVMADNGKLYPLFPKDFPQGMRKLCAKADVIIPNMTEAVLMLNEDYVKGPYTNEYIVGLLHRLSEIGGNKVILTGVYFEEGQLGAACYDPETDKVDYSFHELIPGYYHGTGDVFGSVITSCLTLGMSIFDATDLAVKFTTGSIQRTRDAGSDIRYGVNFEAGLTQLGRDLGL